MFQKSTIILVIVAVAILGFLTFRNLNNDFDLPKGGETKKEKIVVDDNNVMNDGADEVKKDSVMKNDEKKDEKIEKEVMVTDGVRHTIPLGEILSGGPPKDGIPSIDKPKFTTVREADEWLKDDNELGLALELEGVKRFYPYRILVGHEIVNDTINDKRVLVTYCPLCFTGIVFDPVVQNTRVEFGVSGKLWNSNLLMYDRKTDTLWSQISGEAVVGELTGNVLKIIPSDITRYGIWKKANPDGEVLSRDTGFFRSYSSIPYGGDLENIRPFFPTSNQDNRLDENAYIIGIVIDGKAKAFWFDAVKGAGEVTEEFQGKTIVARYVSEVDSVRIFSAEGGSASGGENLKQLSSVPSFWFSWVAVYPDTELYK